MKVRTAKPPAPRDASWCWVALGACAVIVIAAGAFWWYQAATGGRSRLVLDREVVDLGDLQFEVPARAVFSLANAGDGRLKIAEELSVKVIKGC